MQSWTFTFQLLSRCLHQTPSPVPKSAQLSEGAEQSEACRSNRVKQRTAHHCHSDLGHGRTFPDTTSASAEARSAALEVEEGGDGEADKHEPEEGACSLELVASPAHVAGSVRQAVVDQIAL